MISWDQDKKKAWNKNKNLRVTIIVNTKVAYANNDNKGAEQLEDTGGHSGSRRIVELVNRERVTLRTMIVSSLAKLEQA